MASATTPLGMKSMPASGYNHNSTTYNKQYVTWKGTGVNSNPVGTAPGHIRPLTNNDAGNIFQTGFGLPRPIKHYRKGRVIVSYPIEQGQISYNNINCVCNGGSSPYQEGVIPVEGKTTTTIDISPNEAAQINYNMYRFVKSSKGTSLGGGSGGSGLLNDMLDKPGAFLIKQNPINEVDGVSQLNSDCKTCEGVGIVASYYPNETFLTENPEQITTNKGFCCNPEYKAKRRAIYASTNLKKNYYTTTAQYLQNRCKTFEQKAFNFASPVMVNSVAKPGSPSSLTNTYLANCQPNSQIYDATEIALISRLTYIMVSSSILLQTQVDAFYQLGINTIKGFYNWLNGLPGPTKEAAIIVFNNFMSNPYWGLPLAGPSNLAGCQLVVYKPNNYQYAKQGAVDSSTRNLKLNVDTISTNAASIQNYNNTGPLLISANEIYAGNNPNVMNLLKNKAPQNNTPQCNFQIPLNFRPVFQNKNSCRFTGLN
jgi:hypothetical protein